MAETFTTTVFQPAGMNATGLPIPDAVVAALGSSKNPAITVSLNGYSYRSTVATRDGSYIVSLSAENRAAAGVVAGDAVEVTIELDTAPRTVDVPADLASALEASGTREAFDALAPSKRKAFVVNVESAKADDTRARRVAAIVAGLGTERG
jgi:Bacteriocin-protection, YdeI or OmpD-Associated/Domain of unknown function (DUF1905)